MEKKREKHRDIEGKVCVRERERERERETEEGYNVTKTETGIERVR